MLTILVEGCDCAGKTALILKLLSAYGTVHYFHATRFTTIEEYLEAFNTSAQVLIMDRCWISEAIYGPIVRGTEPMKEEDVKLLNAAVQQRGAAQLFFVNAAYEVILERFKQRGDDYITEEQLAKIYNAYLEKLHGACFYNATTPIIEIRTDLLDTDMSVEVPDAGT